MRGHELGRRSEEVACDYLQRNGYTILERNYRAGHKEVDIIARIANQVAFIEVKARASPEYGHPLEAITWQKRREVAHVARTWLHRNPDDRSAIRFDAIAICWTGNAHTLEHVENAWRVELHR